MQVEFRRFCVGMLAEPVLDLTLLRTAAEGIIHEDLFPSTQFMCL